jgi:hypothetical protein
MSRADLNHVKAAVALDLTGSSSFFQFPLQSIAQMSLVYLFNW